MKICFQLINLLPAHRTSTCVPTQGCSHTHLTLIAATDIGCTNTSLEPGASHPAHRLGVLRGATSIPTASLPSTIVASGPILVRGPVVLVRPLAQQAAHAPRMLHLLVIGPLGKGRVSRLPFGCSRWSRKVRKPATPGRLGHGRLWWRRRCGRRTAAARLSSLSVGSISRGRDRRQRHWVGQAKALVLLRLRAQPLRAQRVGAPN